MGAARGSAGRPEGKSLCGAGDRALLRTKELLGAADIGKLRPRWNGSLLCSPECVTLHFMGAHLAVDIYST